MELVKYRLRTMYHKLPSELRTQTGDDLLEMLRDLTVAGQIEQIRKRRQG